MHLNECSSLQVKDWQKYYECPTPHTEPLVHPWDDMSHMQKLIVLRVLRPDKVGAKDFIVIITKGMVLAYSAVCL